MKMLALLAALLMPQTTVSNSPPIQGVWVEWLGCQVTIQDGPDHSGVLLYVPGYDYPFAVVKDASSEWRFQGAGK